VTPISRTGKQKAVLIPFHSDALHTVERFTMIDPYIIDYQLTVEDPKMFTPRFVSRAPLRPQPKETS
jgi:hypothetical protein